MVDKNVVPAEEIISVRGVFKKFGSHPVLKGISLTAAKGEVLSVLGSSGSGKTTMLRCLNLLEVPDSGEVAIGGAAARVMRDRHGRPVVDRSDLAAIRRNTAMVFQSFNLWSHKTILENVIEAPHYVLRRDKKTCIDEAEQLLLRVGIKDKRNMYPAQLSGGQQQRAAIARALAMRPKVLLFDEPTSALDPELVGEVLNVMRSLANDGHTMIVVTHEMGFARSVSSRVVFLHQGQVEEIGAPDEFFGAPRSPHLRRFLSA